MKFIALLLTSFFSTYCFAQKDNTFLLRGNIKHFDKEYFEFGTTGYFKNSRSSIMVDKKGNFSKRIYVDGIQDVFLAINEGVAFPPSSGDTVNITCDQHKFWDTFQISSPSAAKSKELNLAVKIYKERHKPLNELAQKLATSSGLTDSAKFKLINESYNVEMALIAAALGTHNDSPKAFYDNYFKHTALLYSSGLLKSFTLKTEEKYLESPDNLLSYKSLSPECFRLSEAYRAFIFDYVRSYKAFDTFYDMDSNSNPTILNPAKSEYLAAQSNIYIPLIRDWFMAKSLMFSFEAYQYKQVKPLYDDFLVSGTTPAYVDTIKVFYEMMSKLKPGLPAPQFTLKDTNGKLISLSDFKGKLVYIDFGGVYCGPCLRDIGDNAAKVHEKYKNKDIVFINICIDETGDDWKNKIKNLKFEGINLVAEGRGKHPICKDYNINGIPHYVLIDRDGNLANNNASMLQELVGNNENMLDIALGK